ncbi:MAG: SurA N-terminal domain-containing protein [Gammaproteobacteria bacterium]
MDLALKAGGAFMVIQAFRDNIPKWITGIILAVIVVPFALWGINSYFSASADTSVAEVNGTKISPQDFQQAYQNRYQQLEQAAGSAFKPSMIDEAQLRKQVLQGLINNTLLDQHIARRGYRINNAELVGAVQQISAFQVDGEFSVQAYQAVLSANGMTPSGFEARERQDLAVSQLQNAILASAFATSAQLVASVAMQDQQRSIGYVEIPVQPYLKSAQPSEQAIAAYYQSHTKEFMTPEKLTLAYVELDQAKLASGIQASDAQLESLYAQQQSSFKQAEAREAQHILITVQGSGVKAEAAAKAKAENILKQVNGGASFAALAKKYSNDAGSAQNGGNLGWITRGSTNTAFEQALFGISKMGEVVGPVKLQGAYDVIKLDGIRAATVKPFAEVRAQLLSEYQKKKASDEYFALGDQLANLAYEHPDSLGPASKQLNLPVASVSDVTRDNGIGIATNAAVRAKAFSDSVLTQGNNSDPIQIGPDHVVVIRVARRVPSEPQPLAAVHDKIASLLAQQQAARHAAQVATEVQAALQAGKDASAVAKQYQLKFTPPKFIDRTAAGVPAPILSAAFAASTPQADKSETGTVALASGMRAVYILNGVKSGSVASLSQQQHTAQLQLLTQQLAGAEFAAYVANLRAEAKVKVNAANITE